MSAEHWEAQRKQNVIDKKHKFEIDKQEKLRKLYEQNQGELQEKRARQGLSYERQLKKMQTHNDTDSRCARGEYHHNRDAEVRLQHYKANMVNRTTTPRLRYNDVKFSQQW